MDVVRDIIERKQLLAIIQATHIHLAHAARLAANGELASGVAHLISNPLASVIGETKLKLSSYLHPTHCTKSNKLD